MHISDQELRQLVREAIARHTGRETALPLEDSSGHRRHASHTLLPLAAGSDGDGACLIEPTVRCSHCGYCLSFGH
jgi:hypothetical protein